MPITSDIKDLDEKQTSTQLLAVVGELVAELHPGQANLPDPKLADRLDSDLGFDSLSRVELLNRVEQQFVVQLPEQLFATAETPADILQSILSADPTLQEKMRAQPQSLAEATFPALLPEQAVTLPEVLEWHSKQSPDHTHILLYGDGEQPTQISYKKLWQGARRVAISLIEHGLQPSQTVAIMLPTGADYLFSFFGILLAGATPVPVYPPVRLSQIEDHLKRHVRILENAGAVMLITVPEAKSVSILLRNLLNQDLKILVSDDLDRESVSAPLPRSRPNDIAFIQYTSGSTGSPKGVQLSHFNLLANIRAMGEAVAITPEDVFVSWLPLYHDMGLIGAWLGSLYFGIPLVLMSPLRFLVRPQRWLWAIHDHKGTLSAAPNFAYELCLKKVLDEEIEGLDLSSWRMAFNGAEPVSPATIRRFSSHFSSYGFANNTMAPVYGLAECSVGLAFPPPGRIAPIDRIQRRPMRESGLALVAGESDEFPLEFAACGAPLTNHGIRILDKNGQVLPDRQEGHLQFQGPSTTRGYFRNPKATHQLFDGDWLDSGDMAYQVGDEIYLTGRSKDMIIRAGRNIYPQEVEEKIGEIEGIRKGCVAVFGHLNEATGTEGLVVMAEIRETAADTQERLRTEIIRSLSQLIDAPPDDIALVPPHTVLKTSSGKIRRAACREAYDQGELIKGRPAVWRQFADLIAAGLPVQLQRWRHKTGELLYAGYAWTLFLTGATIVWLLVILLPGSGLRRRIMHHSARLLMKLCGIRLQVEGLNHIPENRVSVLVANHSSYLDGLILIAAVPFTFHFVAKAELLDKFIPRLFLQRIGTFFVERFDHGGGAGDTSFLSKQTQQGETLLFFPEGTFTTREGLQHFRLGAFVTATQNRVPVVPVTLKGSRKLLPANCWKPRRNPLKVIAGEPIIPSGDEWQDAIDLRDGTRQVILETCEEPDLSWTP